MSNLQPGIAYIFDTSVFIHALRKNLTAQALLLQAVQDGLACGYSVITELELWHGIKPPRTVQEHIEILRPFERLSLTSKVARRAGEMRRSLIDAGVPKTQGPHLFDCVIAATAEAHQMSIVTSNGQDFKRFNTFSVANLPLMEYSP